MTLLLTGANGFLGSHIAEALIAHGIEPKLLLRKTSDLSYIQGLAFERAEGDVRDGDSLAAALDGVDTVIHNAGLIRARDEVEFRSVNAAGTANLVAAARQAGV